MRSQNGPTISYSATAAMRDPSASAAHAKATFRPVSHTASGHTAAHFVQRHFYKRKLIEADYSFRWTEQPIVCADCLCVGERREINSLAPPPSALGENKWLRSLKVRWSGLKRRCLQNRRFKSISSAENDELSLFEFAFCPKDGARSFIQANSSIDSS